MVLALQGKKENSGYLRTKCSKDTFSEGRGSNKMTDRMRSGAQLVLFPSSVTYLTSWSRVRLKKNRGLSPRANIPTERQSLVGEVSVSFCG
jgi:hypothetical protein